MNTNFKELDDPHIIEACKSTTPEKNDSLKRVINQLDCKRVVNDTTPIHNFDFITRVICDSITAD